MAQLSLTMLVDVSVSGSPVSILSSGAISLEEGKVYAFSFVQVPDSSANGRGCTLRLNNQTTGYERQYMFSPSTAGQTTSVIDFSPNGSLATGFGVISLVGGNPAIHTPILTTRENQNTVFNQTNTAYLTADQSFTSVDLVSVSGASLADGSYLKIWESIQSS